MNNTLSANSTVNDAFRVERHGVIRFITGQRARAAEIQSTHVSIRRNTGSSVPLWIGWLIAGLIVNAQMGAANNGKAYNAAQNLIFNAGLFGGPIAILAYRNRRGLFVDVEGSGSRITSIKVGNYNLQNSAKAQALADELITVAEENS